jgi:hypothetical protein
MMIAFRNPFAVASLITFACVGSGQDLHEHAGPYPELSAPIVDSHQGGHSDAQWQSESVHTETIHPGQVPHQYATPSEAAPMYAPGHHETHVMEMEVAPPAACACGEKKCPGVCTDPGRPRKPILKKPGDRNRGDCPPKRYRMPDCKRAGNPHCVAPWAKCSVTDKYSSWYVGGGSPFKLGRCRKVSEGTWGLDYNGLFGHARVWLNYTRGRHQGGEGAYETDGEPAFVSKAHELMGLGH